MVLLMTPVIDNSARRYVFPKKAPALPATKANTDSDLFS